MESFKQRNSHTYSINVINNIKDDGFEYKLDDNVLSIIQRISSKVGAPNYVKTPVFQKKDRTKTAHPGNRRRRNKNNKVNELTDEEWETFRSFEKTVYNKATEGVDVYINKIYSHLNKLSESNYDEVFCEVCDNINNIVSSFGDESIVKVSEHIFDVASSNKFYSNIYARLYKCLIDKYPVLITVFNETYSSLSTLFKDVKSCDEDDYERLCIINKENDKRKALVSFIINAMKYDLISVEEVFGKLVDFVNMLSEKINDDGNKVVCEEICENIGVMFEEGYNMFKECDGFADVWETVERISECNVKVYPSLTSKCVFKLMDIVEEYED